MRSGRGPPSGRWTPGCRHCRPWVRRPTRPCSRGVPGVAVVRTDAARDDDGDVPRGGAPHRDRAHDGSRGRARRRQRDHERPGRRCFGGPPRALWELGRLVRRSSQLQDTSRRASMGWTSDCALTPSAWNSWKRSTPSCRSSASTAPTSSSWRRRSGGPIPTSPWNRRATQTRTRRTRSRRGGIYALTANRVTVTARVRQKLRGPRRLLFDRAIRGAALYVPEREASKAALVRALFEARRALNELARRHDIPRDDIYLLVHTELEAALEAPAAFASTIEERRRLRESLQQRVPPFWFEHQISDPGGMAASIRRPEPFCFERADDAAAGVGCQRGCRHGTALG